MSEVSTPPVAAASAWDTLVNALVDVEHFVDQHEKFLLAIATVAIAIFTYTLWRATRGLQVLAAKQSEDTQTALRIAEQSADAAKASADAAVSASAPFLHPRILNCSKLYPRLHSPAGQLTCR